MIGLPSVLLSSSRRTELLPMDSGRRHPRPGGPGLRFTDPPDAARLQSGGGSGQATHKVSLRDAGEVDAGPASD
jgi:hypothetical protein